ncbi:MAG: cellulose binding domain-containing protein [Clostridiales bacterium]
MSKVFKKKVLISTIIACITISVIFATIVLVSSNVYGAGKATYDISNDWGSGAVINVKITNSDSSPIDGWIVTWTFPGDQKISSMWNGTYTQNGNSVKVSGSGWNSIIPAKGSTSFGFQITYSGTNSVPSDISVNGEVQETSVVTSKPTAVTTTQSNTTKPTTTQSVTTEPTTTQAPDSNDKPIGWAAASGGTTGGGNKNPVTVKTSSELKELVKGTTSQVIYVSGKIGGSYSIGSNKTIIGLKGAEIGTASFSGSSNVIMRNLILSGGEDTVSVSNKSHHLWFDHLDMRDSNDETLSIVHGSDFITVSWCKYWFTRSGSHRFGGLVGHSDDNSSEDSGKLNVTYHHNWYSDKVIERMPRVRFGKVHVFNNLFESGDTNYVIRCGVHANVLSEKNVFIDQKTCFDLNNSTSDAILQSVDDLFIGSCGGKSGKGGNAFSPPYNYSAEGTNGLADKVRAGAGATMNY